MKLSELVEHTGLWLGYSATSIGSYARFLREARLISGGVKGGGAADMTDRDKVSLLVAVLGCGTARTCAKDLPGLLSLAPTRIERSDSIEVLKDVQDPTFLSESSLEKCLLAMFGDIRHGRLDEWCRRVEKELAKSKVGINGPMSLSLTLLFEIDANHVRINLKANGTFGRIGTMAVGPEMVFGRANPVTVVAGYSRRTHEISYERLVGWGTCLID